MLVLNIVILDINNKNDTITIVIQINKFITNGKSMKIFKSIVALMLFACSIEASEQEVLRSVVSTLDSNISLYLDSIIVQARARGIEDTGLLGILIEMRNELLTKTLGEKLAEHEIITYGNQFYEDFCKTYEKLVEIFNHTALSEEQKNALIHKELSELLQAYFPEIELSYPDTSIDELLRKNNHISVEKCKNLGYITVYVLKKWVGQEEIVENKVE